MGSNRQGDIGPSTVNVQADGTTKLEHVAETALFTGQEIYTDEARALEVLCIMRTVGTGSITINIEKYDKSSRTWINIISSAAIITNITTRLRVTPDLAAAANSIAQEHLPELFRVTVTHNNANPVTYSLAYILSN